MSRRSHNSSARVLVAAPMRWRRSSGWSPTTWLGTRLAKGSGCPERLFPRSPKFGSRNPHTETALFAPAMTAHHRNVGSGNHPAIAGGLGTPDMPPRCRSSPPTPLNSGGILPSCTHTTYWGYLSKADTHLDEIQHPGRVLSSGDAVSESDINTNRRKICLSRFPVLIRQFFLECDGELCVMPKVDFVVLPATKRSDLNSLSAR